MAEGGERDRPDMERPGITPETLLVRREASAAETLRGILAMLAACGSFACGDTMMKLLAGTVPTSELLFIRGCFVTLGAVVACYAIGAFAVLHRAWTKAMAVRALSDTAGGWGFQLALARMPYADLSAVSQLQPLCITAAGALFFGDRVGWRRWTATAIGLMGVLLIIRPGSSTFNWWALSGLAAVLASTARDLATRRVDRTVPPPVIMMLSAGTVTLCSLISAPFFGWSWPPLILVAKLMGAAFFSLVGQLCIIVAVRSGEMAAVAPFRYSIIIFAILSGFLVFGHIPDIVSLLGICIVCGAGLYTFYREQTLRRQAMNAAAGGSKS